MLSKKGTLKMGVHQSSALDSWSISTAAKVRRNPIHSAGCWTVAQVADSLQSAAATWL